MKYQFSTPLSHKLNKIGFKPAVVDYWIRQFVPTFSLERIFARVKMIKSEAKNIKTIYFKPNFNFKKFTPGQHILVTYAINGRNVTRTYSPTDHGQNLYSITIKDAHLNEQQNGFFLSSALNQNLKTGSIIEISQPFGQLTWDHIPTSHQYVFCAGGVGITPFFSLLKSSQAKEKNITLHYWVNHSDEICYKKELEKIATTNPQLKIQIYALNEQTILSKKPSPEHLSNLTDESVILACGPQGFIDCIENLTKTFNVRFLAEAQSVKKANTETESFHSLKYNGKTYTVSNKTTLLEALELHGLNPKHGCRMGICKSCTCTKVSGQTENSLTGEKSLQDNDEIQLCVSHLHSDIEIENL